jgi:hypothetical protein
MLVKYFPNPIIILGHLWTRTPSRIDQRPTMLETIIDQPLAATGSLMETLWLLRSNHVARVRIK